ncbi:MULTISPECIES: hypothetical protein [unclassified Streptomyces]|uniref:hypothetical protein n=1 Tax=unclassified Streptomyces TaxID=2593676 RepID=UPI002DDBB70A|nr:hypothetical protein [Streptomyces sp. NBC_00243]WRZ20922.1 hypothetical protein OHT59_21640 [Streptomyces sp. NBC_00243]
MASGTFQSLPVPTPALDGRISAIVVDPGGTPADVVTKGTALTVEVEWNLTGFLVPLLGGSWTVQVIVDQVGGSNDFTHPIPAVSVPLNGSFAYRQVIALPILTTGVYTVTASLNYLNPAGVPASLGGYVSVGTVNMLP